MIEATLKRLIFNVVLLTCQLPASLLFIPIHPLKAEGNLYPKDRRLITIGSVVLLHFHQDAPIFAPIR